MYNLIFLCVLILVVDCYGMTFQPDEGQKPGRFLRGQIEIRIRSELYPFFASRMAALPGVTNTNYNPETHIASCILNYAIDADSILDNKAFLRMLDTENKPKRAQKNRLKFVLNSFINLEQILDSGVIKFNNRKSSVILNPAFRRIYCPHICEYFGSIEASMHACLAIARIPYLKK